MIPKNFQNKEIGLLGLGVSGKSAFVSLEAGGGNIYAFDDKISDYPNILEPDKWPWEKLNKIVDPNLSKLGQNDHGLHFHVDGLPTSQESAVDF